MRLGLNVYVVYVCCMCVLAVCQLLCVAAMIVMSSASRYVNCTCLVGVDMMSKVYKMKNVGKRMPLYRPSVLNWRCLDVSK